MAHRMMRGGRMGKRMGLGGAGRAKRGGRKAGGRKGGKGGKMGGMGMDAEMDMAMMMYWNVAFEEGLVF